jgi:malonyl-CoA O-methyltransferase
MSPSVRRAFTRAAPDYARTAHFQRETGERLHNGLPAAAAPSRVLDVGCGTGHGSTLIAEQWPETQLVSVDFALPMLQRLPEEARRCCVCANALAIPLRDASVDLFWSNLTLQWCNPAMFLREGARLLRPGGMMAVSTLGPNTFAELRQAFAGADSYRHSIDFQTEEELTGHVLKAGLHVLALRRLSVTRYHANLRQLLGEVRDIGASTVGGDDRRRGMMGKSTWRRFELGYEGQRQREGLPLTYETLFVYAKR